MVKDIKYIIKRILIGIGIAIALMWLKGGLIADVHAATNGYILYDQSYNVLYTNSSTTQQNINVANVSRVRIKFTDAIASGSTYQLTLKIDMTELNYVPYFNSSGVYINAVGQSSEVATISSVVTPQGSSSFLREAVITYTFKSDTTSSNNFWEGSLTHNDRLTYLNASITVSKIADNTGEQIADSTQQIINNNNNNTTNIINNQNENTDKEIESQKVCTFYDKSSGTNGYLDSNGNVSSTTQYVVTKFIRINNNTDITPLYSSNNGRLCFYNVNKSLVSCIDNTSLVPDSSLTIPTNASYVRFTINSNSNRPQFNVCNNGNQGLNDSINEVGETISDSSVDDPSSDIDTMKGKLASNGVITQLITLPITLYQSVLNNINGSCSTFNLGTLYQHQLSLPCIQPENYLGSSLWGVIDVLCCGLFILSFRKKMVDIFNHMSSLKDGGNELE